MIEYIKQNKILLSVIVLLLIAGIYVAVLNCQTKTVQTTPPVSTQQVNIQGSEGFSVNGDVTNTRIITTTKGDNNEVNVIGPNETGVTTDNGVH